MSDWKLVFRVHATQRMFQRSIRPEEVRHIIENGETIEDYPEDQPYPSRLVSGHTGHRPVHVVVADNEADHERIIVTVYQPDPTRWTEDFRTRRRP